MGTTFVPSLVELINYTQAQEDAFALTLDSQPMGCNMIYNTDLGKARIWDGSKFVDSPIQGYQLSKD